MGRQRLCSLRVFLYLGVCAIAFAFPFFPRPKRDLEINPEENIGVNGYLLEGDILRSRRRNAVRDYYQTWINRTVPYVMENLSSQEQQMVLLAMEEIMTKSCVRFIPKNKESDYINIVKFEGCSSSVGRIGGQQHVILGDGCYANGIILHELMHALGFWHEHSRPDRDNYISIIWSNIATEHRTNFEKYDIATIDTLDTVYDYGSVMHYKNNTFARDRNRITINATQPLAPGVEMGQRVKLSETDVIKLKRLYKCNITHCMNPGVPQNGLRSGESFQVGASVFFSCNHGYQLYGSRGRFCLDLGQWTGNLPSCLPDPKGELHICTYDTRDMCGWVTDTTATLNWTLHTRSTPSNGTGPMEDHTMGSAEGWYIYLETTSVKQGDRSRILSEPMIFNDSASMRGGPRVCMMFYYCMHGKEMGALNVYQRDMSGQPVHDSLVFTRTGEQGTDWILAAITLQRLSHFAIVLEAVRGNGYLGDIAVDDVLIGPCNSLTQLDTSAVADTLKCSFDTGLCGLEQDHVHDDFDWLRQGGQTATYYTGPKCDPLNCATGSYIYTESSRPRIEGDMARILTPLLHGDGGRCLLFFWHMMGNTMGNLTVKLVLLDGSERPLWYRSGDQGNDWHYEKLDIVQPPRYYKLAFEGGIGRSYRSDMALDNIEVLVGECNDVIRNDCTFHRDLCSWENVDVRSWERHYGDTPTPATGPMYDHNNNSMEYYLYVESSRTRPNDTATLRSGQISGQFPGYCLQFWYHMYGTTVGTLRLLTQTDDTGQEDVLWQHSANSGTAWHRQAIYVRSPGQDFRILFQARLTGGSEGDIAIDDISIHAGQCETQ
ncbi:MAM and LDL-receptor class A domain-containing protein 1-like [Littorina saxatilis]|uniref:Metalloendopeptidase n=1 Tax=Littorina saxatilis TaxID=31220 RepID=A0AAN9GKF6_9CAEN